jgi:hypothetical protein
MPGNAASIKVPGGPDVDLHRLAERHRVHPLEPQLEVASGRRVVHQDLHRRTERVARGAHDEGSVGVDVGEVGGDRPRPTARGLDVGDRLLQRSRVRAVADPQRARRHHDLRALGREPLRDAATDAAAPAGDDRDLPVETPHHDRSSARTVDAAQASARMPPRHMAHTSSGDS